MPHRGCPHQCSFCNQRHITGEIEEVTPEKVRNTIERCLQTIDSNKYKTAVAFYGGSFTAIEKERQDELLAAAYEYVKADKVESIRLSTRPDAIDTDVLQNLKRYSVTEIELGVQSMCDEVLSANKRGHTAADVVKAAKLIKKHGFSLGLQMMPGLIGDSKEKSLYTAREIAKLAPEFVRIYPTLVFCDTPLYDEYKSGRYTPLPLTQAVDICKALTEIFEEHKIKVIRVGLLVEEHAKEKLIAGPYHDNFRQLVQKAGKQQLR